MHEPPECFRAQHAVHKPFLKPDALEGASCNLGDHRLEVRRAERAEARLSSRFQVWVSRRERRAVIDQPQTGIEIGFEQDVDMDILADVTATADIAEDGIISVLIEWALSVLAPKPGTVIGKPVSTSRGDGNKSLEALAHLSGTILQIEVEELRDVRTDDVLRRKSAEKRLSRDLAGRTIARAIKI